MKRMTNKSRILKYIFRNAPVSRATIAEETELTPATVTTTVAALKEEGIVFESGEEEGAEENAVGRKRIAIDIRAGYAYAAGVEFTEKAIVCCITDLRGGIIGKRARPAAGIPAGEMAQAVTAELRALLGEHADKRVCGVGVAVPGKIDRAAMRMVTNNRAWDGYDLSGIAAGLGERALFENNARAMAYGRYLFHPGSCPESFAYVHIGLGMHCASMMDGELFLGNDYLAGEIGHTIVNPDGRRCECGKYGCLQTYASERWLVKLARQLYEQGMDPLLRGLAGNAQEIGIDTLTTAYSMGDAYVGEYLSQALRYLGVSVSNIAIVLNPEKIFLHGQMFRNEDVCVELRDGIERQLLFVGSAHEDSIEILPYQPEDGAVGAAALAVNRFFIEEM